MFAMKDLHITEIYSSIQGETSLAGFPTVFVRFTGCNLQCRWCDTPHAFTKGDSYTVDAALDKILDYGLSYVCITGGEPLLQEGVYSLMKKLCDAGLTTSLETNGSISTSQIDSRVHIILDIKCPSSGHSKDNLWDNTFDEIKFVIADKEDYDYAKEVCHKFTLPYVLFSPAFGLLDPKQLVDWMLEDRLDAKLNLQIHKYIWSPEETGV
jgi:7-carboxy-7-deazaguanine synthase